MAESKSGDRGGEPVVMVETMDVLQQEIGAWADKTFPDQTDHRVMAHLREEFEELAGCVAASAVGPVLIDDLAVEIADCMILLLCLADRLNVSTDLAIREKMRINRERTWAFDPAYGYDKKVEMGQ